MANPNRSLEIGTGLFVLLGFAALAFLTTQLPGSGIQLSNAREMYQVTADFDNIGDLKVGAPVTMAGVRIGRVNAVSFDSTTFKAHVTLGIERSYRQIPEDTFAAIQTSGLLGAKYVGFSTPGGSNTYLTEGSQMQFTQSALVLEDLVNRLFASVAGKKDSNAK